VQQDRHEKICGAVNTRRSRSTGAPSEPDADGTAGVRDDGRARNAEDTPNPPDEFVYVLVEMARIHHVSLDHREPTNVIRKGLLLWHLRAFQQNWNDVNLRFEGFGDLASNVVTLPADSRFAVVREGHPAGSDEGDEDVAGSHLFNERHVEPSRRLERALIEKHVVAVKNLRQALVDAIDVTASVGAPVVDDA